MLRFWLLAIVKFCPLPHRNGNLVLGDQKGQQHLHQSCLDFPELVRLKRNYKVDFN